jgi:hypothetical protein
MNEVNLRISFWGTTCWMDVETTKVSTIVESFIDGQVSEILVPESYDLAFCHKASKLVFACWS